MTTVKVRIEGQDATGAAWLSAIERAKSASDQMSRLFQASIAGISFAGVLDLGKSALDYGAQLTNATVATRATSQSLQELAYAAKQTGGVELPELTKAIAFMEKALSEAGSGAGEQKKALDALGLSFKQLQGLSPDKQFELIGDRIHELKDPTDAARASADLLGRVWTDIAPMFEHGAAGLDKLRSEADALHIALSDDEIKRLDDASKSVDRLETSLGRFGETLVAKVAPGLSALADQMTQAMGGDKAAMWNLLAMAMGQGGLIGETGTPTSDYSQRHGTIQRWPTELSEVNVTATRFRAPPGFQAEGAPLAEFQATAQKIQVDALQKVFDDFYANTRTDLERQTSTFLNKMDELDQLVQYQGMSRPEFLSRTASALDALPQDEQLKQLGALDTGRFSIGEMGQLYAGQAEKQMSDNAQMPDDVSGSFQKGTDKMTAIAEQAGRNMQNSFAKFLFDPFKGGVRGMAENFLQTMQKMMANEASEKLFSMIGNWGTGHSGGGGLVGGIASFIGGMFGGGKASGGDVDSGTTYMVGEDGPELFTPASHGIITPNNALGGNVSIDMGDTHIHAGGSNDSEQLRRVLPEILAQHRAQTQAQILNAFRRRGLPTPPKI